MPIRKKTLKGSKERWWMITNYIWLCEYKTWANNKKHIYQDKEEANLCTHTFFKVAANLALFSNRNYLLSDSEFYFNIICCTQCRVKKKISLNLFIPFYMCWITFSITIQWIREIFRRKRRENQQAQKKSSLAGKQKNLRGLWFASSNKHSYSNSCCLTMKICSLWRNVDTFFLGMATQCAKDVFFCSHK